MNCPKYVAAAISYQGSTADINVNCDKEECGWWDAALESCIVKSLFCELASLSELAAGIKEKMPDKADLPE